MEAGAVAADGVSTDGGRGVLELLWDVFDQRLAVHALKGPADLRPQASSTRFKQPRAIVVCVCGEPYQFRVHGVRSHYLTADFYKRADPHG